MSLLEHRPLSTLLQYKTFETFTKALVNSLDVAPAYRLIPKIIEHEGFDPEWYVFVYCTYFSLSSATYFCRRIPEPKALNEARFIACSDIRIVGATRQRYARAHALTYKALDSYRRSLDSIVKAAPQEDFGQFVGRLRLLVKQDQWTAQKIAIAFERSLGHANLARPDLGIVERDVNAPNGPQAGCRALYAVGADARFEASIAPQFESLARTISSRLNFPLGDIDIALAKWAKLCNGRYFIGREIHEMRTLLPVFGKTNLTTLMHRAGFKRRLWAHPFNARAALSVFLRRGVLHNREYATHKVRLA